LKFVSFDCGQVACIPREEFRRRKSSIPSKQNNDLTKILLLNKIWPHTPPTRHMTLVYEMAQQNENGLKRIIAVVVDRSTKESCKSS